MRLGEFRGDALKIKINAPPLKGKANKALVGFKDTSILTYLPLFDLTMSSKNAIILMS